MASGLPFPAVTEHQCCIFRILKLGTAKDGVNTVTGIGSVWVISMDQKALFLWEEMNSK